ncbi:hypothetical protein B0T14DRAFT_540026 [Immersiella caudata]|uniref:Tyrosinase copper-binding domain-containing protein n=1 Tax=Immersiella caudata TaxID=314043 RepID=A0AA40BUZ5_9PEZI|nr:hypothetical protein B0T14DRAFT_540026 [Immersiella caudata]
MKIFHLSAQVLPLIGLRVDKCQNQYRKNIQDTIKLCKTGCTKKTILERKEGSPTKKERLHYIDSVYCLNNRTGTTSTFEIPGARTRFDDFVVYHIQQTLFVHASGLLLPYHRYYVWLYEKALREDNGAFIPNRDPISIVISNGPTLVFPPATGGGCVYSGPFTPDKFQIRLGPIGYEPQGLQGGLDLSLVFSQDTRPTNFTKLLDGPGDVHGSGHFLMGTVGLDVFASPSDPVFWLRHAQADRLWTIWQGQDPRSRINQVWGTGTTGDCDPNVTLDSQITLGVISPPKKIRDAVLSIDGDLCYLYG